MKKIKIICFISFVLMMLLSINSVSAESTITVGKSGQNYTTIQDAIAHVEAAGTIKIMSNIELTEDINITTGTFSIDLNGYTISYNVPYDDVHMIDLFNHGGYVFRISGGNVTIKDTSATKTGKIILEAASPDNEYEWQHIVVYYLRGGKLTVDGGTYELSTEEKIDSSYLSVDNGNAVINNSVLINACSNIEVTGGEVTVNNMDSTTEYVNIFVGGNEVASKLTINGGKFVANDIYGSALMFCVNDDDKVIINDGYFESKKDVAIDIYKWTGLEAENIIIKDGTFKGYKHGLRTSNLFTMIQGGTFTAMAEEYGPIAVARGMEYRHTEGPDSINEGREYDNKINVLSLLKPGYTLNNITTKEVKTDDYEDEEIYGPRQDGDYSYTYYHMIDGQTVKVISTTQPQTLYNNDGNVYIEGKFSGAPILTATKIKKGDSSFDQLASLVNETIIPKAAWNLDISGGTV